MAEATVIVRVEDKLKTAFAQAAKAADRTASQLLRDFMREYVRQQSEQAAYDAWLGKKVAAGRAAVKRGQVQSGEDVEAYFAQRRAQSLRDADAADL
jgi:predicted transcriptional regulator